MELLGRKVIHFKFGEGIIKDKDGHYISVEFYSESEVKRFVYPTCFEQYLKLIDIQVESIDQNMAYEYEKTKIELRSNDSKKSSRWGNAPYISSLIEEFYPTREALLKVKKDQEEKIKKIVDRRNIEYLLHFTRIDNLCSILENGLIPVSMQQKMKIHSMHNDEQRIDSKLECTSCSITFPNYRLFYRFRENKFPGTRWVIIVLDKEVLFSPSNIAYYCQTNAAGIFPTILSAKELCTANAFENMFNESLSIKGSKSIQRSALHIENCKTTDPQAEILLSDIIETKYINCICFHNQYDINDYIRKNGQDQLKKYDYKVMPYFFKPREDFMFWNKE